MLKSAAIQGSAYDQMILLSQGPLWDMNGSVFVVGPWLVGVEKRMFRPQRCAGAQACSARPEHGSCIAVRKSRVWPSAIKLRGRLRRLQAPLRTKGIALDLNFRGPAPKRERLIVIRNVTPSDDPPPF